MQTILYIEDNLYNTQLIQRLLSQRPEIELLVSDTGRAGFSLAHEYRPALILLDVHLPDVTGYDVFTTLREDPRTSSIPVVILSADATPGQSSRFLNAGAEGYLTKPLDLTLLLHTIDTVLRATERDSDIATEA